MLKYSKKVLIGTIIASFMFAGSAFAWTAHTKNISVRFAQIKLIVNDKVGSTKAEPFIYNENVYVPVATIANVFGLKQEWDNKLPAVRFSDPNAKIEDPISHEVSRPIGMGLHLWWNPGFQFILEDRINGVKLPIPVPAELEGKSDGQTPITDAIPWLNITDSKIEFYMFHKGTDHRIFLQLLQYEKGKLTSLGAIELVGINNLNGVFGLYYEGRNSVYVQTLIDGKLNSSTEYFWNPESKKIEMSSELRK